MKKLTSLLLLLGFTFAGGAANTNTAWLTRPLSLADALNTALLQNATILKAQNDLQASHGLVVQTRAVALPQLTASGQYKYTDPNAIEGFFPGSTMPNENWNSGIQLSQAVYEGGKLIAAIKAADATKQQAFAQYQTAVANALLSVQTAYYDVLLAEQQITVQESSVKLLEKELEDQQHRLDAGTVPKFNVLRAEVAVANERPNLISARNNYRNSKNNLVNELGYNLPREVLEDIPLNLTGGFDTAPFTLALPDAIQQALGRRTELVALRKQVELQELNIVNAKAGYKPVIKIFAGYNWNNAQFTPPTDLDHDIKGWNAGAEMTWNIFDGLATHGNILQANAQFAHARTDLADQSRQIELAVRTAYSDFIEAREVLDSQVKVQEEADEALREAKARADAGTGTQLDVLDAENSLTQARNTQVQAQHDYATARAKLQRAIGADLAPVK